MEPKVTTLPSTVRHTAAVSYGGERRMSGKKKKKARELPNCPSLLSHKRSTVWCGDNGEEARALILNGAMSAAWKWHSRLVFTQAQLRRFILVGDNQLEWSYVSKNTDYRERLEMGGKVRLNRHEYALTFRITQSNLIWSNLKSDLKSNLKGTGTT